MTSLQYRAVFSYPGYYNRRGEIEYPRDTYGPPRESREEAEQDQCPHAEETLGWRSRIQVRQVTEWGATE